MLVEYRHCKLHRAHPSKTPKDGAPSFVLLEEAINTKAGRLPLRVIKDLSVIQFLFITNISASVSPHLSAIW
jgi:hypothetical protein